MLKILHLSLKSSNPDLEDEFSSYSSFWQKESKFSLRQRNIFHNLYIEASFFQKLPSIAML